MHAAAARASHDLAADSCRLKVRRLEPEDLPAVAALSAAAFGIDVTTAAGRAGWSERVAYPHLTDPGGCFVAVRGRRVIGVAEAIARERLWVLSLFAVDPAAQSAGAGRALIERALEYGPRDGVGLIVASNDPRALRLYALCGFRLYPTFEATGPLDRRTIPAVAAQVNEDAEPDLEAMAALAREVRGAPYTQEIEYALRRGGRLLSAGERGFAVAFPGEAVWLLAAREEAAAEALLWASLEIAGQSEGRMVRWVLSGQHWAISVLVRAGLRLSAYGALCVRGAGAPTRPFIPSGPFA